MSLQRLLERCATIIRRAKPASGLLEPFDILLDGNDAPTILVFTENVNATYFISFDLPLRPLHVDGKWNMGVVSQGRVKTLLETSPSRNLYDLLQIWLDKLNPDAVVMTRYGQPQGAAIMAWFQQHGVPVIYHLDDDLLDVPESLGEEIARRQGNADVVAERRRMIAGADKVYVSTRALYDTIREKVPGQASIVHGEIYAPFLGDHLGAATPPTSSVPVIGYMGSKGHQHDLALVVPALMRLMEEQPVLRFEVFGTIQMPPELLRFKDRVASHRVQVSYLDFLAKLKSLGWTIGLAPLVDAPFNRCKAPTKFIEYTACGIPVVASDNPVYQTAMPEGTGLLVKDGGWYEALIGLLSDNAHQLSYRERAEAHCRAVFSLERLRAQVLETLSLNRQAA